MDAEGGTGSANEAGPRRMWLGLAAGLALGFGLAWSLRKNIDSPAEPPPASEADSTEFAEADRIVIERRTLIYQEGLKTAESAGKLWSLGRKLSAR